MTEIKFFILTLGGYMLEAWQVPLVTQAIELLFDAGKLLIEHMKRKEVAQEDTQNITPHKTDDVNAPVEEKILSKEDALKAYVMENAFNQNREEISHLVNLVSIYYKNYRLSAEKYAKWGDALVPPIIVHEMDDAEAHLSENLIQLRKILEKVTGKRIEAKELAYLTGPFIN